MPKLRCVRGALCHEETFLCKKESLHGTGSTPGGNGASIFRDCFVDVSPTTQGGSYSPSSVGMSIFGSRTSDIWVDQFNTSYAYTGISLDQSSTGVLSEALGDVTINQCVADLYTTAGVSIKGRIPFSITTSIGSSTVHANYATFGVTFSTGQILIGDSVLLDEGTTSQETCLVVAATPGTPGSI